MANTTRTENPRLTGGGGARAWAVVALLFVLTLGAAHAARRHDGIDPDRQPLVRRASQGPVELEGRLDRGAVQVGSDGEVHLELVARGAEASHAAAIRRPTDVVVVLDRSGSMNGDPLARALASVRELIGQLGPDDRFALVTYSSTSEVWIPLAEATSETRRGWLARVAAISANGGTNMSAGLDRAHALVSGSRRAGRISRVILLSDGHANEGDATPEGLAGRAARATRDEYVVSTVGVGDGFDERLMTRLADVGTGNFYYVPHVEVLAGIFEKEFAAARETVASALEIRIETPDGVRVVDAAGYPIEASPDYAVLRPGSLFAGQERRFWVTLRVPAAAAGEIALGDVDLHYTPAAGGGREAVSLPPLPAISAVEDETRFVASLDRQAVATHHVEDTVNRLRQTVSELVARGDYDGARKRLDDVDYSELRALGYDAEETESFADVQAIKAEVERAEAAPAADQRSVRNRLGKSLFESGTDGRRKGAKR